MKKWSKRKIFRTIWFSFGGLFLIWNWITFQSWNLPKDTFENSNLVTITNADDMISFTSTQGAKNPQIIFFQGGMTDPKAYAPLCKMLAENGYTTHLIKANWRMPQNDYQKVLSLFPLSKGNYVVGGHSQGGKIAAQIVYENPNAFKGLFMLGTSHPRDINLSNLTIPALKIYAENDGLASVPEVLENQSKLPQNTQLVLLKGANHSQFGYLGQLLMDNSASITLEDQQQQTLKHLLRFLNSISL